MFQVFEWFGEKGKRALRERRGGRGSEGWEDTRTGSVLTCRVTHARHTGLLQVQLHVFCPLPSVSLWIGTWKLLILPSVHSLPTVVSPWRPPSLPSRLHMHFFAVNHLSGKWFPISGWTADGSQCFGREWLGKRKGIPEERKFEVMTLLLLLSESGACVGHHYVITAAVKPDLIARF